MNVTIANLRPADTDEVHLHLFCPVCGCERVVTMESNRYLGLTEDGRKATYNCPCESCEEIEDAA